ncbi:Mo-dependent nitrogenase C-terminal domain-containing protein [Acaryochloris sp. IP29b_bin.148]|uniref:Mo-dependent nitrogenase C-terminal domain-containing protein n=1 Tax=Acaryochloris sp. IP29b_bin.148 TaxID=2969218 RepID=UPI00261818F4|nr:Mo-dependent nitrogenase C-terminal domain-containing protein [Acaryochloris sp. IP29b_bin.148]
MFYINGFGLPSSIRQSLKQFFLRLVHPVFTSINVERRSTANLICQLVPNQCPFERDIRFLGHMLFHIPPLCKLNPAYEEVVALRFRALSYLADQCGEDVSRYCP